MEIQIWKQLIQILSFRKDLIDTIKPFLEQFNNNNKNEKFNINKSNFKMRKLIYKNEPPLHYAAKTNSKKIEELLILKGADLDAENVILSNYTIIF